MVGAFEINPFIITFCCLANMVGYLLERACILVCLESIFTSFRFLSFFSERAKQMDDSDDIHAALALMYGYAARYASSTVIEARIDALVV